MKVMEINQTQLKQLLIHTLRADGNLIINKTLFRKLGLVPAILLSNYLEKQLYFDKTHPEHDEWFFLTHKQIMKQLQIKEYAITQGKKALLKLELIEIERRGIPSKEWIRVIYSNLMRFITDENYKLLVPPKTKALGVTKTLALQHTKTCPHNKTQRLKETQTKRIRRKRKSARINENDFHTFWEVYPKKTDKGKALSSWQTLCHKKDAPNIETLLTAVNEQKKTKRWKDGFIPLPTTWIRNNRWLDDPKEMNGNGYNNPQAKSSHGFVGKQIEYNKPIEI